MADVLIDSSSPVDKRGKTIRDMFAGVAPRYDFLNHLLSASLDRLWRKRSAEALGVEPGARALDLCCGTGDQALAVGNRGADVFAADFCLPMLSIAQGKFAASAHRQPKTLASDALELPFSDNSFDGATISFGLRNVFDLDRALAEVSRVLKPGGRIAVLEFAIPESKLLRRPYLFYFERILPRIGRLLSPRGAAYSYLPASVSDFPQREDFVTHMHSNGFLMGRSRNLAAGIVCLYTGVGS